MSTWSLGLLLALCVASAAADVIKAVDLVTGNKTNTDGGTQNITKRTTEPTGQTEPAEQTGYTSAYGLFRHWSNGKFLHEKGNPSCPGDNTEVIVYAGSTNADSFRFVQVIGHYGYLEESCGKIIHPDGGSMNPPNNKKIDIHGDRHAGALFTIDQEQKAVIHRSGKRFHPNGGSPNPGDNTKVVLHAGVDDAARFLFVDSSNFQEIPVFPTPQLSGHWEVIHSVIAPKARHTHEFTYSIGKSQTHFASSSFEWSVSAAAAYTWFANSTDFSSVAMGTDWETWNDETPRKVTIEVPAGIAVVTWQYIFEAKQFGDVLQFRSTVLADTDCISERPMV